MLVREIMTAPALSVSAEADVHDALRLLAERRITAIPVVNDAGHVVGVLSEIDALRHAVEPDNRAHAAPLAESEPLPKSVGEIMTSDVHTTTEGADVAHLIDLFTTSSYKSLPVVRDGLLVGVVSRSDVVRALWRSDHDLRDELVSVFHDYGQSNWRFTVQNGVVEVVGVGNAAEQDVAAAIARSVMGVRRVHVLLDAAD